MGELSGVVLDFSVPVAEARVIHDSLIASMTTTASVGSHATQLVPAEITQAQSSIMDQIDLPPTKDDDDTMED